MDDMDGLSSWVSNLFQSPWPAATTAGAGARHKCSKCSKVCLMPRIALQMARAIAGWGSRTNDEQLQSLSRTGRTGLEAHHLQNTVQFAAANLELFHLQNQWQ